MSRCRRRQQAIWDAFARYCLQIAAEEQQLAELDSAQKAAQIEVTRAAADLKALQTERQNVTGQWQVTSEACTR